MKKTRTPYIQFPTKKSPMQTTFMDLIRELGQLTHDDGMVIAAVQGEQKESSTADLRERNCPDR